MESGNVVYVLALLAAAIVIVILLLRVMRSRQAAPSESVPGDSAARAAMPAEDEDYLDSSHIGGPILPGVDPRESDAAARAAAALRNARDKPE
ncbi:MAG TPA: hypothetical protein VMN56_15060 [Casimicrobiaceae bacterium]|nr:hypothetical protein [Casimicrobiaceae bacterium]